MIISKNYEGFILRNKALFHVRRLWAGAYMTNFLGGLRLSLILTEVFNERVFQKTHRKLISVDHIVNRPAAGDYSLSVIYSEAS